MGAELARFDAEHNLRVRRAQMEKNSSNAVACNTKMRFFMMEGFTPALEPKPGSMLLLTDEGSWVPISPREVLADERSPEVSEDKFRDLVDALGRRMPDNPTEDAALIHSPVETSIYQRVDEREDTRLSEKEAKRIGKKFGRK